MNGQGELFPPGFADGGIYPVSYTNEYGHKTSRWLCFRCMRGGMTYSGDWGPTELTLRWARKHHRCRPFATNQGLGAIPFKDLVVLPEPRRW